VEKSARPIIIVRKKVAHGGHHGGAWKVAYADFVTAMMALFIVLWLLNSTSQVDKKKVGNLALAIQVAFQELGVFPASDTQVPVNAKDPMPFSTVQAIESAQRVAAIGRIVNAPTGTLSGVEENGDLSSLQRELKKALAPEISRKEVDLRVVPDGLVISLREIGFFESGSPDIKSSSQRAFSRITSLLAQRRYSIRIEGHTDNVPIHNSRFSSNWELSTARATHLVRLLMTNYNFAPERLSAAGYAAYHPVTDNDTAENRAQNRRVDLVILGKSAVVD
jgi:chemotaxis protein MotB